MSSKQKTLFQSWGGSVSSQTKISSHKPLSSSVSGDGQCPDVIDLCDDDLDEDDALLAQALEESTEKYNVSSCSDDKLEPKPITSYDHNAQSRTASPSNRPPSSNLFSKYGTAETSDPDDNDVGNVSVGADDVNSSFIQSSSNMSLADIPDLPGFDKQAGRLWIYPTNYPVRDYQYNIAQHCLHRNTMVTLPTGLGKTFIAAVVMYNFYRWYPRGKVVFMAPTKPLVAQQIEACYNIMGIPQQDTSEMTGTMNPTERRRIWKERRVFFLTPQVMTNDLSRGTCPADDVKCLVIDEAHRALGNHAYCQVVRELVKYTRDFRILALSATPGSDIKAVQQVISNLLVTQIELRTEDCIDIKPYTHERKVDKIVVPLGEELTTLRDKYLQVMSVVVQRLTRQKALYNRDPTSLSKFLILKAREAFRQNPPQSLPSHQYGVVEGDFALALSLYHGYELLQLHGLRSLYNFLNGIVSGEKGHGRTRTELLKCDNFRNIMQTLKTMFTQDDSLSCTQKKENYVSGHPKMKKLEEVVLEHFTRMNHAGEGATRVMIFSQYRDSVQEITDLLNLHQPRVKAMSFIGQSSAGKNTKGFTQKEQLKVMKEFREGGYNTLISTCVGEEGLDIGDVDLIICFDAHKSPIRLVQRMGRTGRKRQGHIVMLVTEGKEEQIYNQSQYSKRSIHKAIMNGARSLHFYQGNPRMLPDGLMPVCHKMFITVRQAVKKTEAKAKTTTNQRKISTFGKGATKGRKIAEAGGEDTLTGDEYRELQEYLVPEVQIRRLPLPCSTLLCLEQHQQHDKTEEQEGLLSLNEWMPWQNRLQETSLVDHSQRSRHLVELVEFLQLQESLSDDEDHYGMEMEMFLNLEDVLQPGEKDSPSDGSGILTFCTSGRQSPVAMREGICQVSRRKVVRSETLPVIKGWKEDGESEEDLPEFDVGTRSDHSIAEDSLKMKPKITGNGKGKKKGRARYESGKEQKARKRKRVKCDNSLLQPVAVSDVGDFEEDISEIENSIKQDIDLVDDVCVMDIDLDEDANTLPISPEIRIKSSKNMEESNINLNVCVSTEGGEAKSSQTFQMERFKIRTPPPRDHLNEVFKELGDLIELPSLNLVQLVSEWYEETHGTSVKVMWVDSVQDVRQKGRWSDRQIVEVLPQAMEGINNRSDSRCEITSESNIPCGDEGPSGLSDDQMWDADDLVQFDLGADSDKSSDSLPETHIFTSVRPKMAFHKGNYSEMFLKKESDISNERKKEDNNSSRRISWESDVRKTSLSLQSESVKTLAQVQESENLRESGYLRERTNLCQQDGNVDTVLSNKVLEKDANDKCPQEKVATSEFELNNDSFSGDDFISDVADPHVTKSPQADSFTFTQALACVHSSEEHSPHINHQGLDNIAEVSPAIEGCQTKFGSSAEFDNILGEMPSFNLFDDASDLDDHKEELNLPVPKSPTCDEVKASQCHVNISGKHMAKKGVTSEQALDVAPISILSPAHKSLSSTVMLIPVKENSTDYKMNDGIEEEFDMPHFDLEFDLDDIIPPSPQQSQPFSQMSFNRSQTSCVSRRKLESCFQKNESIILEERLEVADEVDRSTMQETSYRQNKDISLVCGQQEHPHSHDILRIKNISRSELHLEKQLTKVDSSKSPAIINKAVMMSKHPSPKTPYLFSPLQSETCSSTPKQAMSKFTPKCHDVVPAATPLPPESFHKTDIRVNNLCESPQLFVASTGADRPCDGYTVMSSPRPQKVLKAVNSDSEDESYQIIRKRKAPVFLDDSDDSIFWPNETDERAPSFKTPTRPAIRQKKKVKLEFSSDEEFERSTNTNKCPRSSNSSNCSKSSRSSSRGQISDHLSSSNSATDEDDFQHATSATINKWKNCAHTRTKGEEQKKRKKRKGCDFLDVEAEMSGSDASSDEDDNTDDDCLEASFVNDNTHMSQLDAVDMQAVYLKSVHSPDRSDHRFRLQPRHFKMNVFSQVPEEDESQYQEDSFCVGEDHEDTEYIDDDDDLLDDFEKFTCYSKRKSKKVSSAKPAKSLDRKSRKRIRHISGSSSEEENRAVISVLEHSQLTSSRDQVTDFLSSQRTDPVRRKAAVIMSSSEEETSPKVGTKSAGSRPYRQQTSPQQQITPPAACTVIHRPVNTHTLQSDTERQRQERLSKQKLKQEEFRQKMAAKSAACVTVGDGALSASVMARPEDTVVKSRLCSTRGQPSHVTDRQSFTTEDRSNFDCEDYDFVSDMLSSSIAKPPPSSSRYKDQVVVLVDSREISGAQDIMSSLRLKHGFTVVARQLTACDYILSNRLAVDRRSISDFCNGTNRGKLTERIQMMRDLYDRCCLIVEKDRVKLGEEKSARLCHRTKYYDWIQALLVQTNVRLFFTENQDETAGLLARLAELEKKKGMNISVPVDLCLDKEQVVKFYTSIPKLSYAHALNLCYNYSSVNQFLSRCTPKSVSVGGHMSEVRAAAVCSYVRHKFDLQMVPSRR